MYLQLSEEHTTATRCSSFPSLGSFFQTTMHRINSLNTALVAHTIQHTSATSVPCCNLGGPITYSAELIPWQGSLHTPHGRWKIKILIFPVQHSGYSIAGNSNWSTPKHLSELAQHLIFPSGLSLPAFALPLTPAVGSFSVICFSSPCLVLGLQLHLSRQG